MDHSSIWSTPVGTSCHSKSISTQTTLEFVKDGIVFIQITKLINSKKRKPHHIGLEHSMISTKCHLKLQRGFSRRIYHLRSKVFMNLEGGNWSRVHIYVPQLTTKKSRLRENRRHSGTEQKQKESTRLSIFNILSILFHS
jgi:hypothetical protein